jgi:uncharacterized protein CbrC (UPF0167 family)
LSLPAFKYHPDPVGTGNVVESDEECLCCGQARGYIYTGPVYALDELDEQICPWCIADGSAHRKWNATFTDPEGVGDYGHWGQVPRAVIEEIAHRTPGFGGWQQERWWTHCGDGAEFLGVVGYREAAAYAPELLEALVCDISFPSAAERERYLHALNKDGSPTGYAFRCTKCGKLGGYSDRD